MHGVGDIYGTSNCDIYLEFGLKDGNVLNMLLLVPLPPGWQVRSAFNQLPRDMLPGEGVLVEATIVISHGLPVISGSRDVQNHGKIDLHGYPLQNGMQIIAKTIQDDIGSPVAAFHGKALLAGVPEALLPPLDKETDFIEIRADVDAGWLIIEKWWGCDTPEGLNDAGIHGAGLAIRCNLREPNNAYAYLLREIGMPNQPIIIEARIMEDGFNGFYPLRYSSRFATRTPLGEAGAALHALIGDRSTIFEQLDLNLPDFITLLGFTYSPKEWIQLSFAAGDYTDKDKHLIAIGPVELRDVDFSLNLPIGRREAPSSVEFEGRAAFFGEQFRVRVRPWTIIEGGLEDLDGINLGQFLENLIKVELPFGLDTIRLTEAWVTHFLGGRKNGPTSTDLRLRLDGNVDLVPGAIQLQAIQIFVSHDSDNNNEFQLSAEFSMGPIKLITRVSYENGAWVFSGTAQADAGGISLTELVNHLVHSLGAAVPAEIPDVRLESFSLEYNTAARSLDIQAITNWEIPGEIPVLGGSDNRVILQLFMSRDAQQGGNYSSLSIDWTLEKSGHRLAANAFLSKESQAFSFDFSVPDISNPAKLTELAEQIGLPDIPRPVGDALDTVFQVSSLSMNYARPGNAFEIAWTRPLLEGMLLAEYNQDRSVPAAAGTGGGKTPSGGKTQSGTNRHVEVSWLGNKEESTLGIDDILALADQPNLFKEMGDVLDTVGLGGIAKNVEEMLTFKQLGFTWEESGENNILSFTALSTYRQGTHSFVAIRSGENKGFVAGISFVGEDNPGEPSTSKKPKFLPEGVDKLLEAVAEILDGVELTHLLVSTVSSNTYQPPAFSSNAMLPGFARQGAAAPSRSFGSGTMTLNKGLSVGARVKFSDNKAIQRVIQIDELDGQLTIGDVFALQISIPGTLSLDAGGGNSLVLTSPMIQIKENLESPAAGPELAVMGGLDLHLFGQRLKMAGWLALAEESITGHIQLQAIPVPIPISPCAYMPGVQLVIDEPHPLSLEVGLQFEPAGLDLGMSGSFAICKNKDEKVYGNAVFVLEMIEEVPNPLYVEFAIDEMSMPILLEAMTGVQYRLHLMDDVVKLAGDGAEIVKQAGPDETKDAAAAAAEAAKTASAGIEAVESALGHVEAILSKVEFTDVRMRWADSIVNLPDGTTAMPGVGVRGGLKIFDWNAFAVMDFSATGIPGISGHFECEPIEIADVLHIWGDGKGVHKTPKTAEDFNDKVKKKVDTLAAGQKKTISPAAAKDEGAWFLEPGGPVLHLSTRSAPFLHADLHASLFGFLQTDIHADITEKGFDFDFKIGAGNAVTAELECHWWHDEGRLEAHGDMGIHLNGDIGPIIPGIDATKIHLDTNLDAHVSLVVDSSQFRFVVNGSFEFQGASLHLPELVLTVKFKSLEDLAKAVWDHIVDLAKDIFAEVLLPIGKFVADAAKEVAHVAVEAAKEVAEVATKAVDEAKQIVADVGETMDNAAHEISKAAGELAGKAEEIAAHAAEKALEAAAPLINAAEELGTKALQFAEETAAHIKAIAEDVAAAVSEAAHYVIDVAEKALQWATQKLDEARRWVAARLEQAAALVGQLADEAEKMVRAIEADIEALAHEIEALGRKLEEIAQAIADAAREAEREAEHLVSRGWHAATDWI
ncbi:MAG: apolipoprotein A1/A4/E family protein [Saprospirales bacterium]|nr:apolipoprotein A1/A4/E family protein [Saprospirales bacterium]